MNKKFKKILVVLLSALMVFTYMPTMAFADASDPKTYTVLTEIPAQDYTGEVPDLMSLDALATISVKEVGAEDKDAFTMTRGTDFTVEADSDGASGSANAVFTATGSFAGDTIQSKSFVVKKAADTHDYKATIDAAKLVYDGNALTAAEVAAVTTVKDGDATLYFDHNDYQITLDKDNAVDAGTAVKVTIKVGSTKVKEETVTIGKADLSKLILTADAGTVTYNGSAQEPNISSVSYQFTKTDAPVALAAADYTKGAYSNNTNAGKASVAITAKSSCKNFTGTGNAEFEIAKFNLSGAHVQVASAVKVPFNGKKQNPAVNVTVAFGNQFGAATINAADYKVDYVTKESINVGTYQIKVVPKDDKSNVTGETSPVEGYIIEQVSLKDATAAQKKDIPAGTAITKDNITEYFDITVNGYKLTADDAADMTVVVTGTPNEANEACTIKITAAQTGNFKETATINYTTAPEKLAQVYVSKAEYTYSGSEQVPTKASLGNLWEKGKETGAAALTTSDYDIKSDWANNINAGTATVTLVGRGKYAGQTAKIEYTIDPEYLDDDDYTATVTGIARGTYYEEAEITGASVTLKSATRTIALKAGEFKVFAYDFSYEGQSKLTEVRVELYGNYRGTFYVDVDVICEIADLNDAVVTGDVPAGLRAALYSDEDALKRYIKVKVGNTYATPEAYSITNIAGVPSDKLGELGTEISFDITPEAEQLTGQKKGCKVRVVARNIKIFEKYLKVTDSFTYDGVEKTPDVVFDEGALEAEWEAIETESEWEALMLNPDIPYDADFDKFVKDQAYTLSYANNVDAGTATITLTGKGDYTGTATVTFEIQKKQLYASDFKLTGVDSIEYKPGDVEDLSSKLSLVKASDASKLAFDAKDFTIALVPGQKIGDATGELNIGDDVMYAVTVKEDSKNYFSADPIPKAAYKVGRKTVTNAEITLENNKFDVTKGTPAIADLGKVTVKVDGAELDPANYSLAIKGVTNKVTSELTADEEKPYVLVEFEGDYAGKAKAPITMVAAVINIKDVKLTAPDALNAIYSGSAIVPKVSDTGSDKLVIDNPTKHYYTIEYTDAEGKPVDGEPTDAGTYTATVKATAAYGGETGDVCIYTITAKKISQIEFNELVENLTVRGVQTYSTPYGTEDYDYDDPGEVSYYGPYTETPEVGTYSNLDYVHWVSDDNFEVISFTKEWDGDPEKKGKATIALKADANYAFDGTVEKEFYWNRGHLRYNETYGAMGYNTTDLADWFEIEDQTYTGKALEPGVKAKADLSADYVTVQYYESNVNAAVKTAKAYVKVEIPETEKKYQGEMEGWIVFTIKPADQGLKVSVKDATYTGKALEPAVTVKNAQGVLLDLDKDYTVAYADNTNAGKGKVTVTCMGNYAGTYEAEFTIAKAKNTMTVKAKAVKAKAKKTKKFAAKKVFTVKKAQGKVTYKLAKKVKNVKLAKNGKLTVKKGLKKGKTIKVKVKVTAKGNANYKKLVKTVTVKVKIK